MENRTLYAKDYIIYFVRRPMNREYQLGLKNPNGPGGCPRWIAWSGRHSAPSCELIQQDGEEAGEFAQRAKQYYAERRAAR